MRSRPADLARRLFRKAENDLLAAEIGLAHGAPLDTVCFHVQPKFAVRLRYDELPWINGEDARAAGSSTAFKRRNRRSSPGNGARAAAGRSPAQRVAANSLYRSATRPVAASPG